jgi:hypothetical protein
LLILGLLLALLFLFLCSLVPFLVLPYFSNWYCPLSSTLCRCTKTWSLFKFQFQFLGKFCFFSNSIQFQNALISSCWRHVTDLNYLSMVVSTKSNYMQKLSYVPNMLRNNEHCFSWLVS